jgi:autotransporter adhesin
VTASGTISAPSYALSTGTYTNVGAALTGLDGRISDLSNFAQAARQEARAGVASAMAMAAAPMPSAPGRTSWSMNVSTFEGEEAFGASMAHRFEAAPFAFTAGVSYSHDIAAGRVGLMGEF